jgi:GntR family transcriptional repressor for pyruvate dehydrogenase complex
VSGITRLAAIDTVRARIGLAVELGLLRPGDRLPPVADLAGALAVSGITARRALETLTDDGILVRRRGRDGGTFVAEGADRRPVSEIGEYIADASLVHELIDRRVLVECALTHFAALNATDADYAALQSVVDDMAAARTWADYHSADERFHVAVAVASAQDFALAQYRVVLDDLYRYFLPYPIEFLHGVNDEHAELLAALRQRDTVGAVAITKHHVAALHETMFVGLGER